MDPDACISEAIEIATSVVSGKYEEEQVQRLGELILAIDGWMSKGGFPPKRWDVPYNDELNEGGK